MEDIWQELVLFVSGGGLTALVAAITEYIRRKSAQSRAKTHETIVQVLRDAHDIRSYLEEARIGLSAQRVLLLYAHNGGGALDARKPIYSSIIAESNRDDAAPRASSWNNQVVDSQYLEILRDITESGSRLLSTSEMEGGKLKDLYVTDGVTYSLVDLVAKDDVARTGIWYISCALDQEDPPTASQRDQVRDLLSKIKTVIVESTNG